MMKLFRSHRALAVAASAITLQAASTHADAAVAPSGGLRALHEALTTGPAGRRYTRASPLGGSLWELTFTTQDLRTKSRQVQSQIVDVDREDTVAATLPVDAGTTVTRSPQHGLEFRQLACEEGKKLAVEVWTTGGIRLARRVIDGVGPKPLSPGVFGSPKFSPSGSAVAFVAERQPSGMSAAGYWPTKPDSEKQDGATTEPGASTAILPGKFALKDARSTGEALLVHGSLVVAWDWRRTDSLTVMKAEDILPDGSLPKEGVATPVQPCFDGTDGGLLFACHLLSPWQPGLSACLNRPTRIYHLEDLGWGGSAKGDTAAATPTGGAHPSEDRAANDAPTKPRPARCLTPSLYFANMPRLSPDGSTLAFAAQSEVFRGHSTVFELRTMPWPPPAACESDTTIEPASSVLVPLVDGAPPSTDGSVFAGVCGFHDELASLTWLDSTKLIFHSIAGATKSTFTLPSSASTKNSVSPLRPPGWEHGGCVELLGASDGTAVVQCSSLRSPPVVWAFHADRWSRIVDVASLLDDAAFTPGDGATAGSHVGIARDALRALRDARVERVTLPREQGGAEALVLIPRTTAADDGEPTGRAPWVLKVHGGPHAVSLDTFSVETALFLASGVGVIFPNYRGSIGYGRTFGESLLGNIGEMDVNDCVALTRASLAQLPRSLDPDRGACYGGSHGGFLTAWLLGCADRALYSRGGVLWNPVVNLPAMLGTTDIPEWVAAEGLAGYPGEVPWPLSAEQLVELHRRSPISVIDRVSAPALMLLGAADMRVPHTQGREWVSALQHTRQLVPGAPEVTALEFPGEGHAIASVEGNAHAIQSAVAWLVDKLKS